MAYSKTILERFQNPRNSGGMHGANAIGNIENAKYGDFLKMYFSVNNNGVIENAKFKACACCGSIACLDVACDLVKGKNLDDALKITKEDIKKVVGDLPYNKEHCVSLTEETIRATIQDYYERQEKETKKAIKRASRMANNLDEE